jgi:hypothetical protein
MTDALDEAVERIGKFLHGRLCEKPNGPDCENPDNHTALVYMVMGAQALTAAGFDALVAENERLRVSLANARAELSRWGWGDIHYGQHPQQASVVNAIRVCDDALGESHV